MEFLYMDYFCEVYRCQNISQAARNKHIAQPSMTVAIQKIEAEIGQRLFLRNNQALYPTEAGTKLYRELWPFVQKMNDLRDNMGRFRLKKKVISLASGPQSFAQLLEPISSFSNQHPEIDIKMVISSSSQNGELLRSGKADLAFGNLEHVDSATQNSIWCFREEVHYCTNPNSPFANLSQISYAEIGNTPLAIMANGLDRYSKILNGFELCGLSPNIRLYSEQIYYLIELAKSGIVDTFLESRLIARNPPLRGIHLVPPRYMQLGFWWRKDKLVRDIEKTFMSYTKDMIGGEME